MNCFYQKGQSAVTLLIFIIMALTVSFAAVSISTTMSYSQERIEESQIAYYTAESGIENAILRLLRDPNYNGETLNVGSNTTVITVTGANPKTISSTSTVSNKQKTISAQIDQSNNRVIINWWRETP